MPVPGITQILSDVVQLDILTPPLSRTAGTIAHVLGTLDDKIELNRRMNETLGAMARALFKSWFVDFDPVRAKMEGCWGRGESLPGLPAEYLRPFPQPPGGLGAGGDPGGVGGEGVGRRGESGGRNYAKH